MSSTFKVYPVPLTAGGTQRLPVDGKYFLIFTQTGLVDVTGDFGTLPGLGVGQGIAKHRFKELIFRDVSGAPNNVTVLVWTTDSDAEFLNLQTILASSSAIALDAATIQALARPFTSTGSLNSNAALLINTPVQLFSAAANINGAVLLNGALMDQSGTAHIVALLAKATAPATVFDGEPLLTVPIVNSNCYGDTKGPQRIAPGLGLWLISSSAAGGAANYANTARWALY